MGTITYRSGPEWIERFGRKRAKGEVPRLDEDFQVENYLAYQGDKFCLQYDPNSYLYISKAMDLFDMIETESDESISSPATLASIEAPTLIVGVKSDILFPVWQQRELAKLLGETHPRVVYSEIDSPYGHDAFLIELDAIGASVRTHLSLA